MSAMRGPTAASTIPGRFRPRKRWRLRCVESQWRNANVLTKTLYPILDRLGFRLSRWTKQVVVQSQLDAWGKLEGAEGGEGFAS